MHLPRSRVTSQGQISIPAEVRRKLGIVPGSIVEWQAKGDRILLRRSGRFSSEEIHQALFPEGPVSSRSTKELKEGIIRHIRERHARR